MKNETYEIVCELMGMLAGAQTIDDINAIKRVCAQVEHALRVDVLPEVGR